MDISKVFLKTTIECIKISKEEGIDNWLNGIVSDHDMELALIAEKQNRSNNSYQKLTDAITNQGGV